MKKVMYLLAMALLAQIAFATVQQEVLDLINSERAANGRAALAMNPMIEKAAQLHSEDMLKNNYFSHTSLDGRNLKQRMNNAGFSGSYYGENIAYHSGSPSAAKVFSMWKNSPGHYSNMMNSGFNAAGIGIASGGWSLSSYSITMYTLDLGRSGTSPTSCTTGTTRSCGSTNTGACQVGTQSCANGQWNACQGAINPVSEKCGNAIDDDCDGSIDENCISCVSHAKQACVGNDLYWYNSCNAREEKIQTCNLGCSNDKCNSCVDSDKDGFGLGNCTTKTDCNDQDPSVNPNAIEVCNQKDDNCNAQIDESCVLKMKVFSPINNKAYSTRSILLNVSLAALGNVSYFHQGRWMNPCRNVRVCTQQLFVVEGDNIIQVRSAEQTETISFFVDSRKPQIWGQKPQSMQSTNGTFSLSYYEDNPKNTTLFISTDGVDFKMAKQRSDCPSGNKECVFIHDIKQHDNRTITYYFSLSDGINTALSSKIKAIADTKAPSINLINLKKTNTSSSMTFQADILSSEPASISYESSQGSRTVCTRCERGHIIISSSVALAFLKVIAMDAAGNSASYSVAHNLLQ